VHSGLPIDFIRDELHVDVEKTAKEFSALVNSFNEYTHLDEHTFDTEASDAELFAEKAIEAFGLLFESIEDCRLIAQGALKAMLKMAWKTFSMERCMMRLMFYRRIRPSHR
jgi:hypothetical protein